MTNIYYNYLVLTFLILISSLIRIRINCDHLQQTNDNSNKVLDSNDNDVDEQNNQQHVAADSVYIKRELKDIIKMKIDSDKDGLVSYEELKNYLAQLHETTIDFNVDKQWYIYSPQIHEVFSWEGYEPEKKEVLTWDHYFNQTYPELIGVDIGIPIQREQDTSRILNPTEATPTTKKPSMTSEEEDSHMKMLKLMVMRADARWKLADENGDTLLTKQEFKMLLHPDEGNEELQNLFVREAVEDMDLDKNGKICLDEFMKHLKVLANDHERDDKNWLAIQQENFGRFLDKNKDGVLDNEEIINWLIPPKSRKFETEAKRLFELGDVNEDHKLSNIEILDHYEQYIGLLPPEYWKDAQESTTSNHDEL